MENDQSSVVFSLKQNSEILGMYWWRCMQCFLSCSPKMGRFKKTQNLFSTLLRKIWQSSTIMLEWNIQRHMILSIYCLIKSVWPSNHTCVQLQRYIVMIGGFVMWQTHGLHVHRSPLSKNLYISYCLPHKASSFHSSHCVLVVSVIDIQLI